MKTAPFSIRILSGLLSAVFFLGNTVFAHSLETNLWTERMKKAVPSSSSNSTAQLAYGRLPQLPPLQAESTFDFHASAQPHPEKKNSAWSLQGQGSERPAEAIKSIHPYGSVRKISKPADGKSDRVVIHVQDVHRNDDAQRNIGKAVQRLIQAGQVDLIALEGSSHRIRIESFRRFPYRNAVKNVADYLLREHKISGPIHGLMTAERHGSSPEAIVPNVIGIDDAGHYEANVQAFKDTIPMTAALKETLEAQKKAVNQKKSRTFNRELLAFDKTVEAYRSGTLSMGGFLKELHAHREAGGNSALFLEALALESSINYSQAEHERNRLLSRLTQVLSESDVIELAKAGLAFRMGRLRHAEFYEFLERLCRTHGVSLQPYAVFTTYLRYVSLANRIDSEALAREMKEGQESVYVSLVKTPEEQALLDQSRYLYLAEKLVDLALTREEWDEYGEMQNAEVRMQNEINNDSGLLNLHSAFTNLHFFERFYREAEIRDEKMAENFLKQLSALSYQPSANKLNSLEADSGKLTAESLSVLVTGGFHSKGITRRLTKAGVTVIDFVPKISKIDDSQGSAYLSVFAQEKTPLEALFAGEKLFVSAHPILPATIVESAAGLCAAALREKEVLEDPAKADDVRALAPAPLHENGMASARLEKIKEREEQTDIQFGAQGERGEVDIKTRVRFDSRGKVDRIESQVSRGFIRTAGVWAMGTAALGLWSFVLFFCLSATAALVTAFFTLPVVWLACANLFPSRKSFRRRLGWSFSFLVSGSLLSSFFSIPDHQRPFAVVSVPSAIKPLDFGKAKTLVVSDSPAPRVNFETPQDKGSVHVLQEKWRSAYTIEISINGYGPDETEELAARMDRALEFLGKIVPKYFLKDTGQRIRAIHVEKGRVVFSRFVDDGERDRIENMEMQSFEDLIQALLREIKPQYMNDEDLSHWMKYVVPEEWRAESRSKARNQFLRPDIDNLGRFAEDFRGSGNASVKTEAEWRLWEKVRALLVEKGTQIFNDQADRDSIQQDPALYLLHGRWTGREIGIEHLSRISPNQPPSVFRKIAAVGLIAAIAVAAVALFRRLIRKSKNAPAREAVSPPAGLALDIAKSAPTEIRPGFQVIDTKVSGTGVAAEGKVFVLDPSRYRIEHRLANKLRHRDIIDQPLSREGEPAEAAGLTMRKQAEAESEPPVLVVPGAYGGFFDPNTLILHDGVVTRDADKKGVFQSDAQAQRPHGDHWVMSFDPEHRDVYKGHLHPNGQFEIDPPVAEGVAGPLVVSDGKSFAELAEGEAPDRELRFGVRPSLIGNDLNMPRDERKAYSAAGYNDEGHYIFVQVWGNPGDPQAWELNLEEFVHVLKASGMKSGVLTGASGDAGYWYWDGTELKHAAAQAKPGSTLQQALRDPETGERRLEHVLMAFPRASVDVAQQLGTFDTSGLWVWILRILGIQKPERVAVKWFSWWAEFLVVVGVYVGALHFGASPFWAAVWALAAFAVVFHSYRVVLLPDGTLKARWILTGKDLRAPPHRIVWRLFRRFLPHFIRGFFYFGFFFTLPYAAPYLGFVIPFLNIEAFTLYAIFTMVWAMGSHVWRSIRVLANGKSSGHAARNGNRSAPTTANRKPSIGESDNGQSGTAFWILFSWAFTRREAGGIVVQLSTFFQWKLPFNLNRWLSPVEIVKPKNSKAEIDKLLSNTNSELWELLRLWKLGSHFYSLTSVTNDADAVVAPPPNIVVQLANRHDRWIGDLRNVVAKYGYSETALVIIQQLAYGFLGEVVYLIRRWIRASIEERALDPAKGSPPLTTTGSKTAEQPASAPPTKADLVKRNGSAGDADPTSLTSTNEVEVTVVNHPVDELAPVLLERTLLPNGNPENNFGARAYQLRRQIIEEFFQVLRELGLIRAFIGALMRNENPPEDRKDLIDRLVQAWMTYADQINGMTAWEQNDALVEVTEGACRLLRIQAINILEEFFPPAEVHFGLPSNQTESNGLASVQEPGQESLIKPDLKDPVSSLLLHILLWLNPDPTPEQFERYQRWSLIWVLTFEGPSLVLGGLIFGPVWTALLALFLAYLHVKLQVDGGSSLIHGSPGGNFKLHLWTFAPYVVVSLAFPFLSDVQIFLVSFMVVVRHFVKDGIRFYGYFALHSTRQLSNAFFNVHRQLHQFAASPLGILVLAAFALLDFPVILQAAESGFRSNVLWTSLLVIGGLFLWSMQTAEMLKWRTNPLVNLTPLQPKPARIILDDNLTVRPAFNGTETERIERVRGILRELHARLAMKARYWEETMTPEDYDGICRSSPWRMVYELSAYDEAGDVLEVYHDEKNEEVDGKVFRWRGEKGLQAWVHKKDADVLELERELRSLIKGNELRPEFIGDLPPADSKRAWDSAHYQQREAYSKFQQAIHPILIEILVEIVRVRKTQRLNVLDVGGNDGSLLDKASTYLEKLYPDLDVSYALIDGAEGAGKKIQRKAIIINQRLEDIADLAHETGRKSDVVFASGLLNTSVIDSREEAIRIARKIHDTGLTENGVLIISGLSFPVLTKEDLEEIGFKVTNCFVYRNGATQLFIAVKNTSPRQRESHHHLEHPLSSDLKQLGDRVIRVAVGLSNQGGKEANSEMAQTRLETLGLNHQLIDRSPSINEPEDFSEFVAYVHAQLEKMSSAGDIPDDQIAVISERVSKILGMRIDVSRLAEKNPIRMVLRRRDFPKMKAFMNKYRGTRPLELIYDEAIESDVRRILLPLKEIRVLAHPQKSFADSSGNIQSFTLESTLEDLRRAGHGGGWLVLPADLVESWAHSPHLAKSSLFYETNFIRLEDLLSNAPDLIVMNLGLRVGLPGALKIRRSA